MKLPFFKEKINSSILLAMTLIASLFFLIFSKMQNLIPVYVLVWGLFHYQGMKLNNILKIISAAFLFSFFCSYFVVVFPSVEMRQPPFVDFGFIKISKLLIETQFKVFIKVGLVSSVSFAAVKIINFEKILIHLMKIKWLNVNFAYPILLAFNSIFLIQNEFEKIKINARFRKLGLRARLNVFFPLLIFAIRHADRGAMSLTARGLNENKSFYFETHPTNKDYYLFSIFLIVIFICCLV